MSPPCVATTDVQKHSLHPLPETHHGVGGNLGEAKCYGGVEVEGGGGLGPACLIQAEGTLSAARRAIDHAPLLLCGGTIKQILAVI